MTLALALIVLLVLFILNVPIAFGLILSAFTYILFNDQFGPHILVQRMVGGLESVPLLAIVFFITAGILMNYTGITRRMLRFAGMITRFLPGSMAQVSIVLSALMGGLSGSNIADAAMQSKIIFPEMQARGYKDSFSSALIASTSLVTPIIPPGIGLILYGFIGNVSIGSMFLAGIIPGIFLTLCFMSYVHIYAKKHNLETEKLDKITLKEFLMTSKDAFYALLLPIVIIGGIRLGFFSATEAGAIAILYALILGFVIYREMTLKQLLEALLETINVASSILIIIAAGSAFGWMLTVEQIPQALTLFMTEYVSSTISFFLIVLVFLLVVGMFMEGNVTIIILTPLFMPILHQYGIDPVHFGIFFLLCMGIGTLTPPLGVVMYTTCLITKTKVEDFIPSSIPFLLVLITVSIIIAFVPGISLWLVRIF